VDKSVLIHPMRNKIALTLGITVAGICVGAGFHGPASKIQAVQHAIGQSGALQSENTPAVADYNRDGKTSKMEWEQFLSLRSN
jgi:hypothetical protein